MATWDILAGHKEKIILRKSGAAMVWLWDRVTSPSSGTCRAQLDEAPSCLL